MKRSQTLVAAVALAATSLPLVAQQRAAVGEAVPDTTFPEFLNGDGRQKLSEFYGQPVVIDQWGTHCPPCVGTAVPNAIRHDHAHGEDGLVTILVESQGSNPAQLEHFLWERFPDNECFSCIGTFVPIPESAGIPFCGVIGVDGKLVWAGNPAAFPKDVEDAVEAELDKVRKGWGDSSDARKVRAALYGKGDFERAAATVAAMADGAEKTALQGEIEKRYAVKKNAIDVLRKAGRWVDAQDAAAALAKGVGKHETWATEAAELLAAFETDAAKAEIALDKKLDKILKTMRKGKLDRAPKDLEKLVERAGQSTVAPRASRMIAALAATNN
ncbi:MAG: hypothetical protein KDE27_27965 [Planctomycetes bacterium]|nr:hypothetical protein [Planctomycetota bacterium]